ncbi:hypothetical protein [Epibacterium sp. Ofav1-8]|uniref:hypothetical protein n=1 Tax=Epibacterium sp. Ofav1-8 TaxID=2917735 RepID=UPI001EF6BD13|nr:hypothetical protein [Epibacterium sp. Ofav1-8]MCG7625868.1 hypothetical protein [Epibacterium sp. Ofav1-8]
MLKIITKSPWCAGAIALLAGAGALTAAEPLQAKLVERGIDWPAAEAAAVQTAEQEKPATDAFLALPASADPTALPVMLFGGAAELSTPGFVSQGTAYAAFYAEEDIQVSISGSKSVLQAGDALTLHHQPTAYENIGTGADYSLERFGAFYTLRITCDAPTTDTRCTEPDYLTSLAETLFVVKGQANGM